MRAIALMSGGLDSTLAARLMQELGLELVALNTVSPFCLCNHRSARGCFHGAGSVAKEMGIKLISINVAEEFLETVKQPKHGYGSNMNPCIDCRILLFKKARELMRQEGASFVITGEVLGQRPMSQMRATMRLIEKEAQLTDLVLRPLSAKVLEPTIPEKEGWVPREKLLGLSGRGRKEQFALAGAFGIKDFPCPSGGCLLTDPEFSKRLKDLMRHDHGFTLNDIALLKLGRHFRLDKAAKLIVGRDEEENNQLLNLVLPQDQVLMATPELAGPTAVGRGAFSDELTAQACRIVARYCDRNGNNAVEIIYYKVQDRQEQLKSVLPFEETGLAALRI